MNSMLEANPSPSILIAGGGIAGLALGRKLRSAGLAANIYERRSDSLDAGLAVNLPGNAVQALAALGLGDALTKAGQPVRRREYRSDKGKLLFEIDEDAFWGADARPHSISRSALTRMLGEGLQIHQNVGVDTVSFTDQALHVRLSDQSEARPDLLVVADGVRSLVREQVFGTSNLSHAVLAQASWRFMVPNPGIDCWTVWAGAEALVLLMPVPGDEVYGWAALTRETINTDAIAVLQRCIRTFPRHVRYAIDQAIAAPNGLYHSPLEEVRLTSWTRDRVVLIGDAAHATAPVWAEGVALALEDAIVLGECLADAGAEARVLAEFERLRRPRVQHVQAMTDAMSKAAKLPVWLRNMLMPVIGPRKYRQTYGVLKAVG